MPAMACAGSDRDDGDLLGMVGERGQIAHITGENGSTWLSDRDDECVDGRPATCPAP